ncbi:hypothetical protein SI859A1_01546 [Aurantimonas manganoxydans SI85-9A1]|uniref:Uncharacterized protein n=1 Tax=Aurantimonas manganoxydans (strain ATCC BAA-1229 / DSM 21871 / SI85-9A1) TaxID=287752 RepID=Q1YID4_AURMS|nr:hypothetical protein SI859A1_01546 [Aurantimonas manganoxydans SI85-9A1]
MCRSGTDHPRRSCWSRPASRACWPWRSRSCRAVSRRRSRSRTAKRRSGSRWRRARRLRPAAVHAGCSRRSSRRHRYRPPEGGCRRSRPESPPLRWPRTPPAPANAAVVARHAVCLREGLTGRYMRCACKVLS